MRFFFLSISSFVFLSSLTRCRILYWSKFKAHAGDEINVTEKLNFISGRIENILEKEKKLVTSIFSFSQNVFKGHLPQGSLKVGTALNFYHTSSVFNFLNKLIFANIVEKREMLVTSIFSFSHNVFKSQFS